MKWLAKGLPVANRNSNGPAGPRHELTLAAPAKAGERRAKRALQKRPRDPEPGYEVGYGKPPVSTQFRPGQSGNPMGRPRGAKGLKNRLPALNEERMKTVVLEEAYRTISIRDGERLVDIPVIQAVIRSIALNAAKGSQKAQHMFTELLQWVEAENRELHDAWMNTAIDYKVEWERALERRRRRGETGPDPLPHPDDIVINVQAGQVEIHGPMTKEEKVKWDEAREYKKEHDEFVGDLEAMFKKRPKDKELASILAQQRKLKAKLDQAVGPYAARLDEQERKREEARSEGVADTASPPGSGSRVLTFRKDPA